MLVVGVSDGRGHRAGLPWVSLALIVVALVVLTAAGGEPTRALASLRVQARMYWSQHPHVHVDAGRARRLFPRIDATALRERGRVLRASSQAPSAAVQRQDQATMDSLVAELEALEEQMPLGRFALDPLRPRTLLRWLSYPFTHASLPALLLCVAALTLVAPAVELLLGRLGLVVTCVAGAAIAGAVHLAVGIDAPLAGLSILAAAGVGVLVPAGFTRRLEVLLPLPGGRVELVAVAWAIPAIVLTAVAGLLGPAPQSPAPLAAAATGALLAFAALGAGLVRPSRDDAFEEERVTYESIRNRRGIGRWDKHLEVARLAVQRGDIDTATAEVDELLAIAERKGDHEAAATVVHELLGKIAVERLAPYRAAVAASYAEGSDIWLAETLYRIAGDIEDGTGTGANALLRAAELNLLHLARPREAKLLAEEVLEGGQASDATLARAREILTEADRELTRSGGNGDASKRPRTGPRPIGEAEHELTADGRLTEAGLEPGDGPPIALADGPADAAPEPAAPPEGEVTHDLGDLPRAPRAPGEDE